jgi:hypothetical protein
LGAGLVLSTQVLGQTIPHPNPRQVADMQALLARADVRNLPTPLQNRLADLAGRPHSVFPVTAFAEADGPSQLFQFALLDTTGFERNVFVSLFPGVNDQVMLTVTGANGGIPTIGAVRMVLEPKPGLPTDPADPRAFIDIFTDISGLFVINNESGWYEGWMLHDLRVADAAAPRPDGHAQFGTITAADAAALLAMGTHHNQPGFRFTTDGLEPHPPAETDHFPERQSNLVTVNLSMGAYNALQQSDAHNYWEFNYTTDWVAPLWEQVYSGGMPGTFRAGLVGAAQSIVPGSGPRGVHNSPVTMGDNPSLPRDPDKFDGDADAQRESRMRSIPSGLAEEILRDVYERPASFEPGVVGPRRLFDAYAAEVARVDQNGDGVISAVEGDIDSASDGFEDNTRLFLPATVFDRFVVTREINDGLLSMRFAPSQRAWILRGHIQPVSPAVPASVPRDGDDR